MSSTQHTRAPCGTNGGYRAHTRRREETCDPCRAAHSAYVAEQRRKANPDMKPYRAEIEHGTANGYRAELRKGIPTCDPCREAASKARLQNKRNQAAREAELDEYRVAVLALRAELAPLIKESNASQHRSVRVAATSVMAAVVQLHTTVSYLIQAHHDHPRRRN